MAKLFSVRLEHRLRLLSGLAIAAYAVMHFGNHTLGLLSVDAMEGWRWVSASVWQHPLGTCVLYGSFLVHFSLALRVIYRRSTLRMPLWEMAQLGFGLAIPFLLAGHVIGTRVNQALLGFDVQYPYVVSVLWTSSWYWIKQPLLLTIVWVHMLVGLHFWLRMRAWYKPVAPVLYAFAVVFPVLAILGFARAGIEMEEILFDPDARSGVFAGWLAASEQQRALILRLIRWTPWVFGVVIATVLAARQMRIVRALRQARYRIHHPSAGVIPALVGRTVLEALRAARVPHASVCGGRARCTTCRVHVDNADLAHLAPPAELEQAALARVHAGPNVRLACQIRPRQDIRVTPLLPANVDPREAYRPGGVSGREQQVVAMFVDLRGSTRLGEAKLPYDVVFLLNQFFAEMSAALEATRGHYAQFAGDGLLALYGLKSGIGDGCRDALRGAVEMMRRVDQLNERLGSELNEPLRIGIGIHVGEAIVGTMGPPTSPLLSAIGDNINIAARLEAKSKAYGCVLVVSAATGEYAGVDLSGFPAHEAEVRGRAGSVRVHAVEDLREIVLPEG